MVILPPRSAGRFLALCEARKAGGIRIHPPPPLPLFFLPPVKIIRRCYTHSAAATLPLGVPARMSGFSAFAGHGLAASDHLRPVSDTGFCRVSSRSCNKRPVPADLRLSCSFLSPRPAGRSAFEYTLSKCRFLFVLQPNLDRNALCCRVRKLVSFHPFCYVFQRHSREMLCPVVPVSGEIAPDTHVVLFLCHQSATSICFMQSPQMRLTALVALTLFLQHGH